MNFDLVGGQCVPSKGGNNTEPINLNCKTQSMTGKCLTCRKYYTLKDGDCVPTGDNPRCHMWNKEGQCECCYYHDRSYLDNNNICSPKNLNCGQFDPQNG